MAQLLSTPHHSYTLTWCLDFLRIMPTIPFTYTKLGATLSQMSKIKEKNARYIL